MPMPALGQPGCGDGVYGRALLRAPWGIGFGYDSEFAFARAFERVVGHAPGRYRAMRHREEGATGTRR
ncbi:hypothetical protein ACFORO_11325 [Amycolatopsis halotolerans]|uniref:HTH araC/xylS-type domain-containing protein n=1 Tax=Amycolatopsis halotolerans TaxID=330083 RepID=A0ABV7QDG5_9PSEU